MLNMSAFVVFVDLSKAFDKLVREVVLVWPSHVSPDQQRDYLLQAGVGESEVDAMLLTINEKCSALEEANVPPHVRAMLLSLHSGAWSPHLRDRVRECHEGCPC